jgi:hypothetical protein
VWTTRKIEQDSLRRQMPKREIKLQDLESFVMLHQDCSPGNISVYLIQEAIQGIDVNNIDFKINEKAVVWDGVARIRFAE